MSRIELPERPRILIVVLRRLGDVLLTTPLIRSVRRAWPDAELHALVFAETAGILEGNPDLDRVLTMHQRPSVTETISLGRSLWRRYALAISTQGGDRPTLFATLAGRRRLGPATAGLGGRLKRLALRRSVAVPADLHRVEQVLLLADALGIGRFSEVVVPGGNCRSSASGAPYAVIHAAPMFRYKQWTRHGWRELAAALAARGLQVVATGGPSPVERHYLDDLWEGVEVQRLDGRVSWPELGRRIAGASLYVGPDTAVTHLAAASGCPTVALYGPTNPQLWGPWPAAGLSRPWDPIGALQHRGNVWLVQNPLPCTPCQLEGCERHLESFSLCLDEMSLGHVLTAIDAARSSDAESAAGEEAMTLPGESAMASGSGPAVPASDARYRVAPRGDRGTG